MPTMKSQWLEHVIIDITVVILVLGALFIVMTVMWCLRFFFQHRRFRR